MSKCLDTDEAGGSGSKMFAKQVTEVVVIGKELSKVSIMMRNGLNDFFFKCTCCLQ